MKLNFIHLFKTIAKKNFYLYFFLENIKNLTGKDFEYDFKILDNINIPNDAQLLDIGAHRGETIKKFKKYKKIIYSFEPINENFNIIKKKFNNIDDINLINCGLGDNDYLSDFFIPTIRGFKLTSYSSVSINNILQRFDDNNVKKIFKSVKFIKTQSKIKKLDNFNLRPFFIKIDCEGNEYAVLKGAELSIKKNNPIILIEHNSINFKKIVNFLKQYQYKPYLYDSFNKKINFLDKKLENEVEKKTSGTNIFFFNEYNLKFYRI